MIRKLKNIHHNPNKQKQNLQNPRNTHKYNKMSIKSVRQQILQGKQEVPYELQWQQAYRRRQSSLNAMFNKRKQVLQDISKKNKHIYIKINNQESHYCLPKIHENTVKVKDNSSINSKELIKISKTVLTEGKNMPVCPLLPIEQQIVPNQQNVSSFAKETSSRQSRQNLYSYNSQRLSNKQRNSKLYKINDIYINF